jgi:hypothetical protein
MNASTLLDNDIMIKVCCYALVDEVCNFLADAGGAASALGVTRFIVAKQIARKSRIADKASATAQFTQICDRINFVEPSEEEITLAAEIEAQAQVQNLPLDRGESQVLAILVLRTAKLMLTGDKRAIGAIEKLVSEHSPIQACKGRLACFEQLVLTLLERHGEHYLRARICREPSADQSMTICFSCNSRVSSATNTKAGLDSYISDVRTQAPTVLFPTNDLSVLP